MKNLTFEQIQQLVKNGEFWPTLNNYYYRPIVLNEKQTIFVGVPIVFREKDIEKKILPYFQDNLKTLTFTHEEKDDCECYVLPHNYRELCLEDKNVLNHLLSWQKEALEYIHYSYLSHRSEEDTQTAQSLLNTCILKAESMFLDNMLIIVEKEYNNLNDVHQEKFLSFCSGGLQHHYALSQDAAITHNYSQALIGSFLLDCFETPKDLDTFYTQFTNRTKSYDCSNYPYIFEQIFFFVLSAFSSKTKLDFCPKYLDKLMTQKPQTLSYLKTMMEHCSFEGSEKLLRYYLDNSKNKNVIAFCEKTLKDNNAFNVSHNSFVAQLETSFYHYDYLFNFDSLKLKTGYNQHFAHSMVAVFVKAYNHIVQKENSSILFNSEYNIFKEYLSYVVNTPYVHLTLHSTTQKSANDKTIIELIEFIFTDVILQQFKNISFNQSHDRYEHEKNKKVVEQMVDVIKHKMLEVKLKQNLSHIEKKEKISKI